MKTEDLYRLTADSSFRPFYKIPVGHTFQIFTWVGDIRPDGSKQYHSNFMVKEDHNFGLLHDGASMTMNERELVRQITNEDSTTY